MSGWVIWLTLLVLLPVGLLSAPLDLKAEGCLCNRERRLNARTAWAWGLFTVVIEIRGSNKSFRLRLAGIPLPVSREKKATGGAAQKNAKQAGRTPEETAKQTRKKAKRKKKHGFGFPPVSLMLNRQLLAAVLDYLKKLFKSLNLRLRLNGIYGTDDPALTGLISGLIAALHAEQYKLDLDADFGGPVVDLEGETSGRIIPMVLLWLTFRLLITGPVRGIWWTTLKRKLISRKQTKEEARYV